MQPSFDKQYVREWLTSPASGWDRHSGEAPPPLPDDVVEATRARYVEAYTRLTGAGVAARDLIALDLRDAGASTARPPEPRCSPARRADGTSDWPHGGRGPPRLIVSVSGLDARCAARRRRRRWPTPSTPAASR